MKVRDLVPWKYDGGGSLMPFDPGSVFSSMHREMDRMFENLNRTIFALSPAHKEWGSVGLALPQVDVVETDEDLQVTAELPGMDEKDVDVSISRDVLTIKGEKKAEKEIKKKDFYQMERSFGTFSRSIPLPASVDTAQVTASFKKGVLSIRLPKTVSAKSDVKKIEVKAE
jgi:HSP20 family protein